MELFEYIDVMNTPYQIYMEQVRNPDFRVKGHWHYFIEILYVKYGSIQVDCGKYRYTLQEGAVIVLPPKMLHRIQPTQKQPADYAVVKFDLNTIRIPNVYLPRIKEVLASVQEQAPMIFTKEEALIQHMAERIEDCLQELETHRFGYELKVYSNLSDMMVEMVRVWEREEHSLVEEVNAYHSEAFDAVLEYIDKHSFENIQVQELARRNNMSYSNFARQFRLQFGRSCKEYIEYIRISKAEELVLYSDYDMSYIAQETGFADASHFIRIYKKFKDETPKQARMHARLLIKPPEAYSPEGHHPPDSGNRIEYKRNQVR